MDQTRLDDTDVTVSEIGLGAMPLSLEGRPPAEDAIAVIHRALELGVTFLDTADSYCVDNDDFHHNERLIARALESYPEATDEVVVATKGGLLRPEGRWVPNGDPERLEQTIRESYEALGGEEPIDLWQLHSPDQDYEIEESLEPAAEAVEEGLIRHVGVSNVSVDQLERARKVVDVVSVQNQWNPWHRDPERDGILDYCDRENLTFIPWSPFGGSKQAEFIDDVDILADIATDYATSPYQVCLAWMMARSSMVLPIPGASRKASIEDSVRAADMELTDEEIKRIDHKLPG